MDKEKFLNDLKRCIDVWWDSFPPEIKHSINSVYDKHAEKNEVTIIWGTDRDFKRSYFFENSKELDAFMLGLEECLGWQEYHIEEREVNDE